MEEKRTMKLRNVTVEDCRLLFNWVNDPENRGMAFSKDTISWKSHCQWFNSKIGCSESRIYIALDMQEEAICQIRFDQVDEKKVEVDVSIAPSHRGKGYGSRLIELGTLKLFSESSIQTAHALVKCQNKKSIQAFKKANYRLLQEEQVDGHNCFHMLCEKRQM
jgi:RimJ/RimL family protein N-acetyltransferase